jgi:hypothetical protein
MHVLHVAACQQGVKRCRAWAGVGRVVAVVLCWVPAVETWDICTLCSQPYALYVQ